MRPAGLWQSADASFCAQAFKKQTLGQEALLREKEEQLLMERKRRYGAPHPEGQNPGTLKAASSRLRPMHLTAVSEECSIEVFLLSQQHSKRRCKHGGSSSIQ